MMSSPDSLFLKACDEHAAVIEGLKAQAEAFRQIAMLIAEAIEGGHKILWCGNGGSAADSQHLAAELVGRFKRERCGIASIALTTDTSILTAIANDYGYDEVFRRQVEALARKGDVVVGISTSGNSKNVCLALEQARKVGARTIALTGAGGGKLASIADITLQVESNDTARIQEAHALVGHALCDHVEATVCNPRTVASVTRG